METKTSYKIAVLTDLSDNANDTIKSAVELSRLVNGSVDLLYTKSISDVVTSENQMSAMRSMDEAYGQARLKIRTLIKSASTSEDQKISHNIVFGNVKREIKKYLNDNNPDVVVLGKRKSRLINGLGDGITQYVLKHHKGEVMIAGQNTNLSSEAALSIGALNTSGVQANSGIANDLLAKQNGPLRAFNIVKTNTKQPVEAVEKKNIVEYIFEEGTNTMKNVSNYINQYNVNLLWVDKSNALQKGIRTLNPEFNVMINQLNAPILVVNR